MNEFPEDVQTPTIIEMDINDTAAITLAVNNEQADNLYNYVDSRIVPEFEKLSSVASVDVSGGQEEYIKVELIPEKLAQYHLNMNTIAQCVLRRFFHAHRQHHCGKQKAFCDLGH